MAVVVVSAVNGWTPVLSTVLVLGTPAALGLVTGVPAGICPPLRAARIEPVAALRPA